MNFYIPVFIIFSIFGTDTSVMLEQAVKSEKYGDLEQAVLIYEKILNSDPSNEKAINRLGFIYLSKGLYSKALKLYKDLVKLNPKNKAAWYIYGTALKKTGQYEQAIRILLKAYHLNAEDASPLYMIAHSFEILGKLKKAKQYYSDFLVQEKSPEYSNWIKNAKTALKRISLILKKVPGGAVYQYCNSMYEKSADKYAENLKDEAYIIAIKGLSVCPAHKKLLYALSSLTLELNLCTQSSKRLKYGLDMNPRTDFLLYANGWCYLNAGDYYKALSVYKTQLSLYPGSPDALYGLAKTYLYMKRYAESLFYFRRYLEKERRKSSRYQKLDAIKQIGFIRTKIKNKGKNFPAVKSAPEIKKLRKLMKAGMGINLLRITDLKIRKNPRNVKLYIIKAEILVSLGKLEQAEKTLEQATAINPEEPGIYRIEGMIFLKRRFLQHARASFKEFLILIGKDPIEKEYENFIKHVLVNIKKSED